MKLAQVIVLLLAIVCSVSDAATAGRQALTTSHLRVCADPNNLPFSNEAGEGFENRIVQLIGKELGKEVRYTWYPQSTGFVRNTLKLRQCDLISGIATTSETVQNTNSYYHSAYSMVYRQSLGEPLTSFSDPRLKTLRLGIIAGTPPVDVLAVQGLLSNIKSYHLLADTRRHTPAKQAVLDVASGETDVAFIWGPIAGYYAKQSDEPLTVTPLLNENRRIRMNHRVSMAVRHNETDWKHTINAALARLQPQIDEILMEYGVPLLNDRGELRNKNP